MRLDPETLLDAYAQGAFPMAEPDGQILWYTADPRGVVPLEQDHAAGRIAHRDRHRPAGLTRGRLDRIGHPPRIAELQLDHVPHELTATGSDSTSATPPSTCSMWPLT